MARIGWDEQSEWVDAVRNYRAKPITFELRRRWNGDIDFASELPVKLFDVHTIEMTFTVPAREKLEVPATVVNHLGSNKKQNRIRLK